MCPNPGHRPALPFGFPRNSRLRVLSPGCVMHVPYGYVCALVTADKDGGATVNFSVLDTIAFRKLPQDDFDFVASCDKGHLTANAANNPVCIEG